MAAPQEFTGGVLWYGPTHAGTRPVQKRIITERLVRWAARGPGRTGRQLTGPPGQVAVENVADRARQVGGGGVAAGPLPGAGPS